MRAVAGTFRMMAALWIAGPAAAEVKESDVGGFSVSHVRSVKASPDTVWAALIQPARWWSSPHSWSGDAKNLSMEPRVGGCYCERWRGGEAEHARVVQIVPGKLLRLRGAFGPLQGEALTGTLSVTLAPEGAGTKISVDYVVGGHARFPLAQVAPAVDGVIGEQFSSLAKLVGG